MPAVRTEKKITYGLNTFSFTIPDAAGSKLEVSMEAACSNPATALTSEGLGTRGVPELAHLLATYRPIARLSKRIKPSSYNGFVSFLAPIILSFWTGECSYINIGHLTELDKMQISLKFERHTHRLTGWSSSHASPLIFSAGRSLNGTFFSTKTAATRRPQVDMLCA